LHAHRHPVGSSSWRSPWLSARRRTGKSSCRRPAKVVVADHLDLNADVLRNDDSGDLTVVIATRELTPTTRERGAPATPTTTTPTASSSSPTATMSAAPQPRRPPLDHRHLERTDCDRERGECGAATHADRHLNLANVSPSGGALVQLVIAGVVVDCWRDRWLKDQNAAPIARCAGLLCETAAFQPSWDARRVRP
jgi:hypothetical protein